MTSVMQMSELPNIEDINPYNSEDEKCFEEVRAVLERHGKLSRFGLCLLHNHFEMNEDEILSEVCNEVDRVLTIKPIKKTNIKQHKTIETIWRLDTGVAQLCCHAHGPEPDPDSVPHPNQ